MSDDKPNYPYVPLPKKEHPLTAADQAWLDMVTPDWERYFFNNSKPTGGFTKWLTRQHKPG